MSDDNWPPEGTRVRILGGIFYKQAGTLFRDHQLGYCVQVSDWLCVHALERHEIEVIDEA